MYKVFISNGELIDKFLIIEIKISKISNDLKLENLKVQYDEILPYFNNLKNTFKISKLIDDLKRINLNLWEQEDNIRIKEKQNIFDEEFINIARLIHKNNDERSYIKNKINQKTESKYSEEKIYKSN